MAIQVEVHSFAGRYAKVNQAITSYPVGMAEAVAKAITVGGHVTGSVYERTMRRGAIANTVLSSVRHNGPAAPTTDMVTTRLYDGTETTEKTGISFRLGMAFAAVAAGRVLDVVTMRHVRPRAGGRGRRADLVGRDRRRRWHVMEAKSRSYGLTRAVIREAKDQAASTGHALTSEGLAVDTVSGCLTDLSESCIYVLLTDPPPSSESELSFDFDEASFFADYYSPVPELLEVCGSQPSGHAAVDAVAEGAWLPGAAVWLGLARPLLRGIRESRTEWEPPSVWVDDSVAGEGADSVDNGADSARAHVASDGHALVLSDDALEP